jgi:peptide/nickel transport system substrate-binding protein
MDPSDGTDPKIGDLTQAYLRGSMSRRQLIRRLALLGLSIPTISAILAACGGGSSNTPTSSAATKAPTTSGSTSAGTGSASPAAGGTAGSPAAGGAAPVVRGKAGGTAVAGVYQEPNSLNWTLTGGPISFATMQLYPLFEPLIRYNQKGEMEPALLTEIPTVDNGGISKDGLTYTIKMHPGVTWEDGTPCTVNDFKFTWQFVTDPKNNAVGVSGWSKIKDIQVQNDTTAVITLKELYIPFVSEVIAFNPLLPQHVQGKMTTEEFGRKPVGNGPFKFVEWVPGDHITYQRNDKYWRQDKALLDKLIFKIVPDRNTVIAQAKTGDIDIGVDYTEAQIPEMQNVGTVTLSITPSLIYERYHFTMVTKDDPKKPHPIFGDVNVRKAVAMAIDRQTIIDKILFGKTKIAKNELDNTPWENTSIKLLPFDQAQAKKLLDDAGWKPGSDGIRAKDGVRFSFTHGTTAGNQTRETIQALVQANLKDIGVEMKIANQPASKFFGSFSEGGGWVDRTLDMVGFTNGLPSGDPNLEPFWSTSAIPTKDNPGGLNSSGLSDPKLDQLLSQQSKELDEAKRKEELLQAQQIIHDDIPMVPMYDRVSINSISKRMQGVAPSTFGSISGLVWNTADWSIKS